VAWRSLIRLDLFKYAIVLFSRVELGDLHFFHNLPFAIRSSAFDARLLAGILVSKNEQEKATSNRY
jgi:hypothetical protein